MSKTRFLIILASVFVIAGSFFVVLHNVGKVPPEVVMPNSKPASAGPEGKTAMTVDAAPAQQAVTVATAPSAADHASNPHVATVSTSPKTTVSKCDTTQAAKPVYTPSSILSSVVAGTQDSAKQIVLGTVSRLGSTLQDVTGGLSQ
ncbi:MAG TPA: hypothetical protein VG964_03590 [Candidatus Saccharimonadales bacterium]|nr:hypothetical protein [Candidatus Saccharimonadales bacterium]